MNSNLSYGLVFLLTSCFNLYTMILLARILLQIGRASPFHPVTRSIITATKWPVGICQRFLPTKKNIDFAIILVILLTAIIKILSITLIRYGILPTNILGLIIWGVGDASVQLTNLLFYALIVQVISSWLASGHSPLLEVVYYITAPLLKPLQRILPALGGLDLSPVLAIIVLKGFEIIVSWNIINVGQSLTIN